MSRRVVLKDHKASLAERGVDIETEDGQVFHVDPPQLWSDEAVAKSQAGDSNGLLIEIIGGPDRYAAFKAAGGSLSILDSITSTVTGESIPES